MVDTLTHTQRSERMSRIRGRDTGPEWAVRRAAHAMGYRYRLHRRSLPGRPDLVFPSMRKAIYVHGCFWHRHPDPACKLARLPKSRVDFWMTKLQGNRERDIRSEAKIEEIGWRHLVIWECETADGPLMNKKIKEFLER